MKQQVDPRENLLHKIRHGIEPDSPELVERFLALHAGRDFGSVDIERGVLLLQFRLLLDTANDASVPEHWRCLCLDHIHRPLSRLGKLACCIQSRERLRKLTRELRHAGAGLAYAMPAQAPVAGRG